MIRFLCDLAGGFDDALRRWLALPERLRHEADASEAAEEQHRPFSSLS